MIRHSSIFIILTVALITGCADRNEVAGPGNNQTDTENFILVGYSQTPGWAQDVFVANDTAYVAEDEMGVSVWNVSDLAHPKQIEVFQKHSSSSIRPHLLAYAQKSGLLLVANKAGAGGVVIFDAHTRKYQTNLGSSGLKNFFLHEKTHDTLFIATADVGSDGIGYLKLFFNTTSEPGFSFWDDENKTFLKPEFGVFHDIYWDDNFAYIARGQAGLEIRVDSTGGVYFPIKLIGYVDTPGSAYDLDLNDDRTIAVVADFQAGLQVIDVSDKENPHITGSVLPKGVDRVFSVVAVGDTAYFLDEHNAIFAVDFSDPYDPALIGTYKCLEPSGVFVTDDHTIFLTDEDLGLLILQWRTE